MVSVEPIRSVTSIVSVACVKAEVPIKSVVSVTSVVIKSVCRTKPVVWSDNPVTYISVDESVLLSVTLLVRVVGEFVTSFCRVGVCVAEGVVDRAVTSLGAGVFTVPG